jgi:hypothetical protein
VFAALPFGVFLYRALLVVIAQVLSPAAAPSTGFGSASGLGVGPVRLEAPRSHLIWKITASTNTIRAMMNVHMNPPPAKKDWGFCGSDGFVSCMLSLRSASRFAMVGREGQQSQLMKSC